jgi:OmpA-OmpF porin, OOP family
MTILEPIINEVSEQFGLRGKAGPTMNALLIIMSNERTGGLQGFLDQFRRAGLGETVSSWVSRGSNTPITTEQLERAIGNDTVNRVMSNVGVARAAGASALAYMIPRVVDLLTPEGVVPSRLPAWVNSYLSGVTARPEPVRTEPVRGEPVRGEPVRTEAVRPPSEPVRRADTGGSTFLRLLPFLALPLLGFLVYRACRPEPEQMAYRPPATASPTAPAGTQPQAQVLNSRLSVINSGGRIQYSGVVPDEQTKQNVLNQLKSTFGEGNISGDIGVDSRARAAAWTSGLSSALPNFKAPGSEVTFDGNSINVGGTMSENAKSDTVAKLKSVYGAGLNIGAYEAATAVGGQVENTRWELAELYGKPVAPPWQQKEPYLQLNPNGKTLQGFTGCNSVTANYQLNGAKVKFSNLTSTKVSCGEPYMKQESAFLNAFKATDSWKLSGDKLELYGGGKLLARFEAQRPE